MAGLNPTQSRRRRLLDVFVHEMRVGIADRSLPRALLLMLALIGYALHNGLSDTRMRDAAAAEVVQQDIQRAERNKATLGRIMAAQETPQPFSNPADPSAAAGGLGGQHVVMPSAALAPLAFGQSDMIPSYYKVVSGSRISFMYDSEIENPWNLFNGRFDVAFVLTYLLPLVIFMLSYNMLGKEREHGTLKLVLSQQLGLRTLVLGKVLARALPLLACVVIVPIVTLLVARPETRSLAGLVNLGLWSTLAVAYGVFWFALAAWVDSISRSSAASALVLVACWVSLVLLAPLALNVAVSEVHPAPSRAELATRTRMITNDSVNRNEELLGTEYGYVGRPELLLPKDGRFEVSARLKAFFLMAQGQDAEIQLELDRFDEQLQAQQSLVERLAFVTPAIVVHEGMTALAGNGVSRYMHFQRQVREYHDRWRTHFLPKIMNGIAIRVEDYDNIPRWAWVEQDAKDVRSHALLRAAQMLALTLLLGMLCVRSLRRYAVV